MSGMVTTKLAKEEGLRMEESHTSSKMCSGHSICVSWFLDGNAASETTPGLLPPGH